MPEISDEQRRTMMFVELWNCPSAFEFLRCPLYWDRLETTNDPEVRFCTQCDKKVYQCNSPEEFVRHGQQGHCVSIRDPPGYGFGSLMGRPSPEDIVEYEREKSDVRRWWSAVLALQPNFAPTATAEVARILSQDSADHSG